MAWIVTPIDFQYFKIRGGGVSYYDISNAMPHSVSITKMKPTEYAGNSFIQEDI